MKRSTLVLSLALLVALPVAAQAQYYSSQEDRLQQLEERQRAFEQRMQDDLAASERRAQEYQEIERMRSETTDSLFHPHY